MSHPCHCESRLPPQSSNLRLQEADIVTFAVFRQHNVITAGVQCVAVLCHAILFCPPAISFDALLFLPTCILHLQRTSKTHTCALYRTLKTPAFEPVLITGTGISLF